MKRQRNRLHIRYMRVAAALVVLAVLVTGGVMLMNSHSKEAGSHRSDSGTVSSFDPSDVSVVFEEPKEQLGALGELKDKVSEKLSGYPGEWSAYVKNLDTGDWFSINDRQIYPASMIKLFALGACYQQIEDGLISESDYYTYIYSMAVMSNNKAFNHMIWTIGRDYLTKWCHENGYTKTSQYHGLSPADNADGLETSDKPNETCASDVGHMLESIYRGKCVSKQASEKMLDLLKQQHWRGKIPSGVPYGVEVANKTGDTEDYSHDAAIVYSEGADYILVIMSENPKVSFQQDYRFVEISSLVYNYFNKT